MGSHCCGVVRRYVPTSECCEACLWSHYLHYNTIYSALNPIIYFLKNKEVLSILMYVLFFF